MSNRRRLALVVGSQCPALGELSFLPSDPGPVDVSGLSTEQRLLVDLRDLLVDGPGECDPVEDGIEGLCEPGLLLNPTAAQAAAALRAAMSAAHYAEAVLVVHVLAHGTGYQADPAAPVRHLLHAWDTVAEPIDTQPESRAWEPYADITARWPHCPGMTGLVLVVDSCKASWAKAGVAAWSGVRSGLMSVVLAASGDHSAWNACLTRTIEGLLREGLPAAAHHRRVLVSELLALDVEPLAAERCVSQTPHIDGRQSHNPVLKLARNPAADALARQLGLDATTAGLVLRLTRHYVEHAVDAVAEELEGHRIVAIVGPAGSGKSTLAAALRLAPEESTVPIGLIDAAAFVSTSPGVRDLAETLAAQLQESPAFAAARARFARQNQHRWDTLDPWQREVIEPLTLLRQSRRLLIDGLDQLEGTVHERPVWRAIGELLDRVPGAALVMTSRNRPALPDAHVVPMPALEDDAARRFLLARGVDAPRHGDLMALAGGSWLVLDLAADYAADGLVTSADTIDGLYAGLLERARARRGPIADDVLTVVAAGAGSSALPVDALHTALEHLTAHAPTRGAVLEVLGDEDLYRVIDRSNAGTPADRVAIFHPTLTELLQRQDLTSAHAAIAEALEELSSDHDPRTFRQNAVDSYAFDALPQQWWAAGRPERLFKSLLRTDVVPGVNLARWQQWEPVLAGGLGNEDRQTLAARGNIAFWTGQTGQGRRAVSLFEELLADQERVLGPDDPETLATRGNLARWTGELGNARRALELFEELLSRFERVRGPDDRATLMTRANIAAATGQLGDVRRALELFQQVLPDFERAIGRGDRDTLATRTNIARYTAETGDRVGALMQIKQLLPDMERFLGADHPDTLFARGYVANFTAEAGDPAHATKLFEDVLPHFVRVLGPDHPATLVTRGNLALSLAQAGNPRRARELLGQALGDAERVLGPDHPETLLMRANLANLSATT
jgi:tetratricopeptide (TPR) repeat protein